MREMFFSSSFFIYIFFLLLLLMEADLSLAAGDYSDFSDVVKMYNAYNSKVLMPLKAKCQHGPTWKGHEKLCEQEKQLSGMIRNFNILAEAEGKDESKVNELHGIKDHLFVQITKLIRLFHADTSTNEPLLSQYSFHIFKALATASGDLSLKTFVELHKDFDFSAQVRRDSKPWKDLDGLNGSKRVDQIRQNLNSFYEEKVQELKKAIANGKHDVNEAKEIAYSCFGTFDWLAKYFNYNEKERAQLGLQLFTLDVLVYGIEQPELALIAGQWHVGMRAMKNGQIEGFASAAPAGLLVANEQTEESQGINKN